LACRPGLGEFFKLSGLVSEVIEIDKRSAEGRTKSLERLRAQEWDYIFVPHESVRTALWMTRLKARKGKVGFAKWWNAPFYSKRVVKPVDLPDALRQLSLLSAVDDKLAELYGSDDVQCFLKEKETSPITDFRAPAIPEWASMQVKAHRSDSKRVFLAPGSVWNTKRWTPEGYVQVARQLIAHGYAVELVGSQSERALCSEIAAAVPGVVNRAGDTSLAGLVDLLSDGVALICNDSGAMHAAAAAGLPTVAIFGPTVLSQGFRPWQNQAVVVSLDLGCRPCGKHGSQKCPIGTHACMHGVSSSRVMQAFSILVS
jgi:heptosyltransferase-2